MFYDFIHISHHLFFIRFRDKVIFALEKNGR